MKPVTHDTIVLERTYPASPARVFAAWADPAKKRRWFGESEGSEILACVMDFRVGGRESWRFRFQGGHVFVNETVHLDIVDARRIVDAYTMAAGDQRISASLMTVELEATAGGTRLLFTEQAAFFEGADGAENRRKGWEQLLRRLEEELRTSG